MKSQIGGRLVCLMLATALMGTAADLSEPVEVDAGVPQVLFGFLFCLVYVLPIAN